ncbi:hypothetical protein ACFYY2_13855 [Streptomyces sp. NPDC001822]|uniref:hypothetical protein n=1 Tax=Streptomyces sp. NPDC001822 TaxID=3364614 RepID=UPI00368E61B1
MPAVDGGPVLVVDMGAELTEVALLADGLIADARQAYTGLTDLEPDALPAGLAVGALDMIAAIWREDRHGAVRAALRRGPVLIGGGALRSDVTGLIGPRLGVTVRTRPGPAPFVPERLR